ncbi:hypothetical protein [Prevotella sp.]|uniref:hypothetical protein n=1 Tax=uncultured Prevotella sp. TaxID=159272 RepID=UPI0025FB6685|nr:hypothetical protein [uncultured Prevotella sp.]
MYTLAHAKVRRIGTKLIKSQEKGAEMHFFKVFIKKVAKTFGGLTKKSYLCTRNSEMTSQQHSE